MDENQILTAARAVIALPNNLARRELARDADGNPVDPCSESANSWCSKGALLKVLAGAPVPKRIEELLTASNHCKAHYVGYTDTQPHPRVIAMWDAAILKTAT